MAKTVAELRKERNSGKYNVSGRTSVKKTKTVAELRKERDSGKYNIIVDKSVKKDQNYEEKARQRKLQRITQSKEHSPLKNVLEGLPEKPSYSDINTRKTELENLRGGAKRRGVDTKDYEAQIDALNSYMVSFLSTTDKDDDSVSNRKGAYEYLKKQFDSQKEAYSSIKNQLSKDERKAREQILDNLEISLNLYERSEISKYDEYSFLRRDPNFEELATNKGKSSTDLHEFPVSSNHNYPGKEELERKKNIEDFANQYKQKDESELRDPLRAYEALKNSPDRGQIDFLKDIVYPTIIGSKEEIKDNEQVVALSGKLKNWDHLSEDERNMYYYLLDKMGREAAEGYLQDLQIKLDKRYTDKLTDEIQTEAKENPLKAAALSAISIPSSVVGGAVSFADNAVGLADEILYDDSGNFNPYSRAHTLSNFSQAVRGSVGEYIDEKAQGINLLGFTVGDAYQALMSGGDSMLAALLLGDKAMLPLAGAAGSARAKQLYEQGESMEEIALGATSATVFEALFEKIGLDNLMKITDVNTIRKLIVKMLGQAGIEAGEEVGTEISNNLFDLYRRRERSDLMIDAEKFIEQGYSKNSALGIALAQKAYEAGMGGFISGGGMGSVASGSSLVENTRRNKVIGNQIASQGNAEVAINKALNLPDTSSNTKIKKLAQEIQNTDTSKLSKPQVSKYNKKLGQLYDMLQASSVSDVVNSSDVAVKDVIKQKLTEYGVTERTDEIASAIYKQFRGQETNAIDKSLIKDNHGEEILAYLDDNKSEVEEAIASRVSKSYRNLDSVKGMLGSDEISDIDIEDFNLSDDGKTYIAGTSSAVEVGKIETISKDDIVVSLSDGSEESVKNLDLGSSEQAVLYQGVLDIQSDLGVKLDTSTANALVTAYNNMNTDAKTYVMDAKVAIMKGYANVGANTLKTNVLGNKARIIYDLGVRLSENETARRKKAVANKVVPKNKSTVTFEDIDRNNLTELQRVSVDAIEKVAEATGVNFVFFRSVKKNGKFTSKYDSEKGSPNGFYKASTNTVYLDINAGATGKGTILFTAGHELAHEIREWSPESFKTFADFLAEKYTAKGESFDALIRAKMQQLDLTYDEAYEEVVADSCESFLIDSNLIENVEELSKRDMNLANKIKDFLKKLLQKVREVYKKFSPDSYEGKYVREMRDSLSELHGKWIQGIKNATENLNNAKTETTKNTANNDGVKFSISRTKNMSWEEQINEYFNQNSNVIRHSDTLVVMANIPSYMSDDAINDLPIALPISIITKAQKGKNNSHTVTEKNIKELQTGLETPIAAVYDESRNSMFVVTSIKQEGLPVCVALALNTEFDGDYVHKATSIHIRQEISNYFNNLVGTKIFVINKNELAVLCREVNILDRLQDNNELIEVIVSHNNNEVKKNSLRDTTYLKAVNNGDMETAQRMVDEYAEEVFANSKIRDEDGKLLKVYHGTYEDFTVFDKTKGRTNMDIQGMFFSPWDIDAKGYGPNVRAFYLNITNPANESTGYKALRVYTRQNNAGVKARGYLEKLGYDGVNNENEEFIAFNSEQIKSADPVTYDDNGDIIPLSKRFDFENEDIRYQARPDFSDILFDEFDGEVTDNDARLITEYIDGNANTISHILDKTKTVSLSEAKVKSLVSRMLSSYELSKDNQKSVYVAALSLLESTDRREVLDNLELLKTALTKTIQSSSLISEYDRTQRADVLEYLRDFRKEYSVYLNDEQLSSLEFQGRSVSWLKKQLFPLVDIVKQDSNTSKKKISFGYFWHDISEVFPDLFSMEYTDSVDNWEMFLEKIDRIKNPPAMTSEESFGISEDELANELTGRLVADAVEAKYNNRKNAYVAKLVDDLRKSHNLKITKNNAKIREQVKTKERERYEKVELRAKIRRMASVNERRLTNPNKSNFIPRPLVAQAVDVMNSLNLDSGRSERLSEKIAKLKASYNMLKEDAKYMSAYDDVVADMLDVFLVEVGNTNITKMSLHQLQVAYKTLRALETAVNASAKMIDSNIKKDIYTLGRELISETEGVSKTHDSLFYKYINTQMRPETFFESLADFKKDSSWLSLYDMLNEGQLKSTRINMEFSRTFEELLTDTANLKTLSDTEKLVDVGLTDNDGNKVFITRGMMLGLYMHLGNVDNANHIARGGLTVPGLKEYYKGNYTKAFGTKQTSARAFSSKLSRMNRKVNDLNHKLEDPSLTEEDRKALNNELTRVLDEFNELSELEYANGLRGNIEKLLTEYEKKWIKTAHYFFDTQTKSEINNVSNLLYGFEKATVENYYPIHTDSSYRVASFENIVRDFALENVGFMKNRIKGASTPILLEDITDVITNYISSVSKYCGMTIPIKNFQKVYGVSTAGFDTSVQKELQLKFSDNATKYIDNLITDLTTSRSSNDLFSKSFGKVRGNLAKAVLSVNLRVAIAQAASYPTAAAEIGWDPLLKAFVKGGKNNTVISRADKELIAKWSPLLWYRMQGYSTTEIGDLKNERNKQVVAEKKLRWLLGWIQAVDGATVGRLWYASEYYVQKNSPKLKKGTDSYYEEVAKVFNRVVERTQPNYTTLQRPDILRNPNAVLKSLTMFMTQRAQNYNIMYSASAKYLKYRNDFRNSKNGVTIEDVKEAKVGFQRAVSSQITATVTLVAMKALSDAILHSFAAYTDDDDELTLESVSSRLIDMFVDTLVGNVAFGTEAYSFAKIVCNYLFGDGKDYYYGVSLNGIDTISGILESFLEVAKEPSFDTFNDLAVSVCQVLGQPLGNVEKIAIGLYNWYLYIANGEFLYNNSVSNNKESKDVSKFRRKYESGDTDKASLIVNELIQKEYDKFYSKGHTEEDAKKKANSEVRAKFTRAYKDVYLHQFFEGDSSKAADIRRMMYSTGLYGSLSEFDKIIAGWKKDYTEDLELQKRAKERTK